MLRFVTAVHPQMDRDRALTHNLIRDLQLPAAAGGIAAPALRVELHSRLGEV